MNDHQKDFFAAIGLTAMVAALLAVIFFAGCDSSEEADSRTTSASRMECQDMSETPGCGQVKACCIDSRCWYESEYGEVWKCGAFADCAEAAGDMIEGCQ